MAQLESWQVTLAEIVQDAITEVSAIHGTHGARGIGIQTPDLAFTPRALMRARTAYQEGPPQLRPWKMFYPFDDSSGK